MYRPRTKNEWALFCVSTFQALSAIALDLYVLLEYTNWVNPVVYQVQRSYVIPLNFALFALGNFYQALLTFDALRLKNNLQLWAVCLLNFCLFVFSILRNFQTKDTAAILQEGYALYDRPFTDRSVDYWAKVKPVIWASAILIGVSFVISTFLVFLLQLEFRWAIYRHISGSLQMLRRYLAYQVLLVLLRMEIFFLIGFILLYGLVAVHYVQPEFGLTIAIIPAMMIQIVLTIVCTKAEHTLGASVAIVLRLGEMAYLLNRILVLNGNSLTARTLLKDEMLLFASVALVLAIAACINAMLCVVNFHKGLKPLLQNSSWKQRPHEFQPVHQHRYAQRIELD